MNGCSRQLGLFCLILSLACSVVRAANPAQFTYHNWPQSWILTNGVVEVVVVPAVGRVMQFKFAGEQDGPFWENRAMDGLAPDPRARDWGNFGGDKTWPAPQADWPKVTARGWPPPTAFDSMPVQAAASPGLLTLTSPTDQHYGIRTIREISLSSGAPEMRIVTTFEKIQGGPIKTGVWIITQLKDPELVVASIPPKSLFRPGYNRQSEQLPLDLKFEGGLLSMKRDPASNHKIGTDASTLLWIGKSNVLRIDSPRRPSNDYPDQQSSAEVYTNQDPNSYVELEMLGPMQSLRVGDKLSQTNTYRLFRRSFGSVSDAVTKALAP